MKKIISFIVCGILILSLCGCEALVFLTFKDTTNSNVEVSKPKEVKKFTINNIDATVMLPSGWFADMEDTELDLFCTNNSAFMGVLGYHYIDFTSDKTSKEIWQEQTEQTLEDIYKNSEQISYTPSFTRSDKTLDAQLYSATVDDSKIYICFIFVEQKENPDRFLWMQFSCIPSQFDDYAEVFEEAAQSVKFLP